MKKSSFIAGLAVLTVSGSAVAGKPLFVGQAEPKGRAVAAAQAILKDATSESIRVMRTDAAAVDRSTKELSLDLGLANVTAMLDKAEVTSTGSLVWTGQLKGAKARPGVNREARRDEMNSVVLVRRGNGITGSIRVKGKLYRIHPLPDGNHAVIEVDEAAMPDEHPEGAYRDMFEDAMRKRTAADAASPGTTSSSGTSTSAFDPGTTATIRVMVLASKQAVANYSGDMQALVELAVAETNAGYSNSNVGITMELAGYYASDYSESGSAQTDLSRFSGTTDGYMDGYHATRDEIGADVNVLITNGGGGCGLGTLNATAASAFSVVIRSCATGNYSFGHEIGHNLGAHHDPANGSNYTYSYGHGYQYNNEWRTVMSYPCTGNAYCPRLNYWSSPDISYNGVPMGNADKSNNRRVLIERKSVMAAFRGDPASGNPPPANANPVADFSYSASGLTANFTDKSTDSDGTIASRKWEFGDGTTSTSTNPSKTYTSGGTYTVKLTVTDDDGATNSKSQSVTVTAPAANKAPVANFSYSVSGLTASFVDASSDSDGSIASRKWEFGDGTSSTVANPSKTYSAAGTYTVKLTVTDDDAATHSVSRSVTVSAPATNNPPAANFSSSVSGLTASFMDTSTDSDGSIASRSWDFGDGTGSTLANPNHTYAAAGTYTVRLTVKDNNGASSSKSGSVTVTAPAPAPTPPPSGSTQTYSNGADVALTWTGPVTSSILVSGRSGKAPATAKVSFAIVHPNSLVEIELIAPDGTAYPIKSVFDNYRTSNLSKTVTVDLSAEDLNGTWKLSVEDWWTGTNKLDSWSIEF